MIGPRFVAMASEFPHVAFAKVDVDDAEDIAERCGITAMPTFHFYRGGERVAELCGAEEPKLRALLARYGEPPDEESTKKRKPDATSAGSEAAQPSAGKRRKGDPQPVIDTATKPIKWKKIIAKELKTSGGHMGLKALRKACVAEVRALSSALPNRRGHSDGTCCCCGGRFVLIPATAAVTRRRCAKSLIRSFQPSTSSVSKTGVCL